VCDALDPEGGLLALERDDLVMNQSPQGRLGGMFRAGSDTARFGSEPFFAVRLVLMQPVVDRESAYANFPCYQVDRGAFFQVQLNGAAFDFVTLRRRIFPTGGNDGPCAILARRAASSSPPRRTHPFLRSFSLLTDLVLLLASFHP
jgi:hypothetical protein